MIPCLLLLGCNFHSNCPYSVQSNSSRFASQVEKLSWFLLSKCNGRTHFLSSPVADVLPKADKEEAEVFIWQKPGLTKAAWGQAALSPLCWDPSHVSSQGWRANSHFRGDEQGDGLWSRKNYQSPVSPQVGSEVLTVGSLEHLEAYHCVSAAFSDRVARNSLAVIENSNYRTTKKKKGGGSSIFCHSWTQGKWPMSSWISPGREILLNNC